MGVAVAMLSCDERSKSLPGAAPHVAGVTSADAKLLRRYINLPREPLSMKWQTRDLPRHGDWSLCVLFRFSRPDLDAIIAASSKLPGPPAIPADLLNIWFPAQLRDRYAHARRDARGVLLEDAMLRTPDPFVVGDRSPLVHGSVAIWRDEQLAYLDLYTM
jgi:hypothetical protein